MALLCAAPAGAAEITLRVTPKAGVRLGTPTEVTGRVTEGGVPLAGRVVDLELRRHPFTGPWTPRGTARTRADGGFSFFPGWTAPTRSASGSRRQAPTASTPRRDRTRSAPRATPSCC